MSATENLNPPTLSAPNLVVLGQSVTFTAVTSGTIQPISFNWLIDYNYMTTTSTNQFQMNAVPGTFRVDTTSDNSNYVFSNLLTILPEASIILSIVDGNARLTASNNGATFYKWYMDGILITGETSTYTPTHYGRYRVDTSMNGSTFTMGTNYLYMGDRPDTLSPAILSAYVRSDTPNVVVIGQPVTLTAVTSGTIQPISYNWLINYNYMTTTPANQFQMNAVPGTFRVDTTSDNSNYVFSNIFTILPESTITSFTSNGLTTLTASDNGATHWKWYVNNVEVYGQTNRTYELVDLGTNTYSVATSANGLMYTEGTIFLPEVPLSSPVLLTPSVKIGTITVLAANTEGLQPRYFNWFVNDNYITTTTINTFQIYVDIGTYRVDTTVNRIDFKSSNVITVLPAPTITSFTREGNITLTATNNGATYWRWWNITNDVPQFVGTANTYVTPIQPGNVYYVESSVDGSTYTISEPIVLSNFIVSMTSSESIVGKVSTFTASNASYFKWFFNGEEIPYNTISSYTTILKDGTYSVAGSNDRKSYILSDDTFTPTVVMLSTPVLLTHYEVSFNSPTTLFAVTEGVKPEYWNWYLDGVLIAETRSDNLTIQLSTGLYHVETTIDQINYAYSNSITLLEPIISSTSRIVGKSSTLTVNHGVYVKWFFNDELQSQSSSYTTVLQDGRYTVAVSNDELMYSLSVGFTPTLVSLTNPLLTMPQLVSIQATTTLTSTTDGVQPEYWNWYLDDVLIAETRVNTLSTTLLSGTYRVETALVRDTYTSSNHITILSPILSSSMSFVGEMSELTVNNGVYFKWFFEDTLQVQTNTYTTTLRFGKYTVGISQDGITYSLSIGFTPTLVSLTNPVLTMPQLVSIQATTTLTSTTDGVQPEYWKWYLNGVLITKTRVNTLSTTLLSGTYHVETTLDQNDYTISNSVIILPEASISATSLVMGELSTLTVSNNGATLWKWYFDGTEIDQNQSSYTTTLAYGTYTAATAMGGNPYTLTRIAIDNDDLRFIEVSKEPTTDKFKWTITALNTTLALSSYLGVTETSTPSVNVFTMEMTPSDFFNAFEFEPITAKWTFKNFLTTESTHTLPTNVTHRSLMTMFLHSSGQNMLERYLQYIANHILPNYSSAYLLFTNTESMASLNTVWQELVDLSDYVVRKYNEHVGISYAIATTIKMYNFDSFTADMPNLVGNEFVWKMTIIPPLYQTTRWIGDHTKNNTSTISPFLATFRISIVDEYTPLVYHKLDTKFVIPSPTANYAYTPPSTYVESPTYPPYIESPMDIGGFVVGG
jgi:hypothetical protein